MRLRERFLAACLTIVVSAMTLLSGCGVPSIGSSRQQSSSPKATETHANTQDKTAVMRASASARMSAEQLGQYSRFHGGLPPFGGIQVVRVKPSRAIPAIPRNFRVTSAPVYRGHDWTVSRSGGTRFNPHAVTILDSWQGSLLGRPFVLDIYREKSTRQIIVGVSYAHRALLAYALHSTRYILRNFTGSYAVFAVPNLDSRIGYAVRITTGQVITAQTGHLLALKLTGCYPCVGAYGANYITGLPTRFPFSP